VGKSRGPWWSSLQTKAQPIVPLGRSPSAGASSASPSLPTPLCAPPSPRFVVISPASVDQECGQDPPLRPAGPSARGHFPSPGFDFLMCEAHGEPGRLGHIRQLLLCPGPVRPLCALSAARAPAPAPAPRDNPCLVSPPASRVFCSLRLRLFSRAEPQPSSSSQWAAQQLGFLLS
jgi:hypothetical protein